LRWCFFSPGYQSIQVLTGDTRMSGGAEAQVAYLAAALAGLGHEVGLVYGNGRGESHRCVLAGVTCIDAAPSWRHPSSVAAFWQALSFLSPDLLYTRLPSDFIWMLSLFARRHQGARFIYALANDLHCTPWSAYDYKRWFHAPIYALGLMSADLIAIQHDHQGDLVSSRLRDRLVRVPNLVRSTNRIPRAYGATVFDAIWIAKIRPAKRLECFLDLAAALPDHRFAVVGGFDPTVSADLRASLEERLLGLDNLVYFGPQRAAEVSALLAQSRVLVNTSSAEGFPNTMLEAWSAGVPVVSLSVDPGRVLEREQIGFVSGTGARLCGDVSTLAGTESLNLRLGTRGLAYVRRQHSLDAVCDALMQAFHRRQVVPAVVKPGRAS
jgi:glycosyltransferase involved in cell wall biosynthesis